MSAQIHLLVYYLVLAFIIGTAAQLVTGYSKRRLFTTLILGFLGVAAGDFVSKYFGFWDFYIFGISIIWSIAGAVLIILLFRLIRGRW